MELVVKIKKKLNNFMLDVDFVSHDKCLGLLGSSGCGKSMTLKCIAGIETPDEGFISLNGRVLFDSEKKINLSIQKRKVGYFFQNYALFPTMNVEENIKISNPRQEEVDKWVKLLQLEDLMSHRVQECSGGQQQRVALARLFVCEPELILLDEPFSALDRNLRENVYFDLKKVLASINQQIILVSHDKDEMQIFCDRAVVFDEGRQVENEEIHKLFEQPKTKASALLVGEKNIYDYRCLENGICIDDLGLILNIQRTQDGTICIPLHAFYPAEDGIDCSCAHKLADLIQIPVGKRYLYSKIEADFIQINEKECLFLD